MVRPAGFEPATLWFEARYSNPLSYGRVQTNYIRETDYPKRKVMVQADTIKTMPKIKLSLVNNILLGGIVLINVYIILAPLAPAVIFWWEKNHTSRLSQLSNQVNLPSKGAKQSSGVAVPVGNTLIVPAMLLETPILEGPTRTEYNTLDQGVWRWPLGSTPDKGGNTILIGHRFTYSNPRGIFYELNQVKVGDYIAVFWNGTEYVYRTTSVASVQPNDVAILNQTKQAELTLYTCTPTWNPTQRLVVTALLSGTKKAGTT